MSKIPSLSHASSPYSSPLPSSSLSVSSSSSSFVSLPSCEGRERYLQPLYLHTQSLLHSLLENVVVEMDNNKNNNICTPTLYPSSITHSVHWSSFHSSPFSLLCLLQELVSPMGLARGDEKGTRGKSDITYEKKEEDDDDDVAAAAPPHRIDSHLVRKCVVASLLRDVLSPWVCHAKQMQSFYQHNPSYLSSSFFDAIKSTTTNFPEEERHRDGRKYASNDEENLKRQKREEEENEGEKNNTVRSGGSYEDHMSIQEHERRVKSCWRCECEINSLSENEETSSNNNDDDEQEDVGKKDEEERKRVCFFLFSSENTPVSSSSVSMSSLAHAIVSIYFLLPSSHFILFPSPLREGLPSTSRTTPTSSSWGPSILTLFDALWRYPETLFSYSSPSLPLTFHHHHHHQHTSTSNNSEKNASSPEDMFSSILFSHIKDVGKILSILFWGWMHVVAHPNRNKNAMQGGASHPGGGGGNARSPLPPSYSSRMMQNNKKKRNEEVGKRGSKKEEVDQHGEGESERGEQEGSIVNDFFTFISLHGKEKDLFSETLVSHYLVFPPGSSSFNTPTSTSTKMEPHPPLSFSSFLDLVLCTSTPSFSFASSSSPLLPPLPSPSTSSRAVLFQRLYYYMWDYVSRISHISLNYSSATTSASSGYTLDFSLLSCGFLLRLGQSMMKIGCLKMEEHSPCRGLTHESNLDARSMRNGNRPPLFVSRVGVVWSIMKRYFFSPPPMSLLSPPPSLPPFSSPLYPHHHHHLHWWAATLSLFASHGLLPSFSLFFPSREVPSPSASLLPHHHSPSPSSGGAGGEEGTSLPSEPLIAFFGRASSFSFPTAMCAIFTSCCIQLLSCSHQPFQLDVFDGVGQPRRRVRSTVGKRKRGGGEEGNIGPPRPCGTSNNVGASYPKEETPSPFSSSASLPAWLASREVQEEIIKAQKHAQEAKRRENDDNNTNHNNGNDDPDRKGEREWPNRIGHHSTPGSSSSSTSSRKEWRRGKLYPLSYSAIDRLPTRDRRMFSFSPSTSLAPPPLLPLFFYFTFILSSLHTTAHVFSQFLRLSWSCSSSSSRNPGKTSTVRTTVTAIGRRTLHAILSCVIRYLTAVASLAPVLLLPSSLPHSTTTTTTTRRKRNTSTSRSSSRRTWGEGGGGWKRSSPCDMDEVVNWSSDVSSLFLSDPLRFGMHTLGEAQDAHRCLLVQVIECLHLGGIEYLGQLEKKFHHTSHAPPPSRFPLSLSSFGMVKKEEVGEGLQWWWWWWNTHLPRLSDILKRWIPYDILYSIKSEMGKNKGSVTRPPLPCSSTSLLLLLSSLDFLPSFFSPLTELLSSALKVELWQSAGKDMVGVGEREEEEEGWKIKKEMEVPEEIKVSMMMAASPPSSLLSFLKALACSSLSSSIRCCTSTSTPGTDFNMHTTFASPAGFNSPSWTLMTVSFRWWWKVVWGACISILMEGERENKKEHGGEGVVVVEMAVEEDEERAKRKSNRVESKEWEWRKMEMLFLTLTTSLFSYRDEEEKGNVQGGILLFSLLFEAIETEMNSVHARREEEEEDSTVEDATRWRRRRKEQERWLTCNLHTTRRIELEEEEEQGGENGRIFDCLAPPSFLRTTFGDVLLLASSFLKSPYTTNSKDTLSSFSSTTKYKNMNNNHNNMKDPSTASLPPPSTEEDLYLSYNRARCQALSLLSLVLEMILEEVHRNFTALDVGTDLNNNTSSTMEGRKWDHEETGEEVHSTSSTSASPPSASSFLRRSGRSMGRKRRLSSIEAEAVVHSFQGEDEREEEIGENVILAHHHHHHSPSFSSSLRQYLRLLRFCCFLLARMIPPPLPPLPFSSCFLYNEDHQEEEEEEGEGGAVVMISLLHCIGLQFLHFCSYLSHLALEDEKNNEKQRSTRGEKGEEGIRMSSRDGETSSLSSLALSVLHRLLVVSLIGKKTSSSFSSSASSPSCFPFHEMQDPYDEGEEQLQDGEEEEEEKGEEEENIWEENAEEKSNAEEEEEDEEIETSLVQLLGLLRPSSSLTPPLLSRGTSPPSSNTTTPFLYLLLVDLARTVLTVGHDDDDDHHHHHLRSLSSLFPLYALLREVVPLLSFFHESSSFPQRKAPPGRNEKRVTEEVEEEKMQDNESDNNSNSSGGSEGGNVSTMNYLEHLVLPVIESLCTRFFTLFPPTCLSSFPVKKEEEKNNSTKEGSENNVERILKKSEEEASCLLVTLYSFSKHLPPSHSLFDSPFISETSSHASSLLSSHSLSSSYTTPPLMVVLATVIEKVLRRAVAPTSSSLTSSFLPITELALDLWSLLTTRWLYFPDLLLFPPFPRHATTPASNILLPPPLCSSSSSSVSPALSLSHPSVEILHSKERENPLSHPSVGILHSKERENPLSHPSVGILHSKERENHFKEGNGGGVEKGGGKKRENTHNGEGDKGSGGSISSTEVEIYSYEGNPYIQRMWKSVRELLSFPSFPFTEDSCLLFSQKSSSSSCSIFTLCVDVLEKTLDCGGVLSFLFPTFEKKETEKEEEDFHNEEEHNPKLFQDILVTRMEETNNLRRASYSVLYDALLMEAFCISGTTTPTSVVSFPPQASSGLDGGSGLSIGFNVGGRSGGTTRGPLDPLVSVRRGWEEETLLSRVLDLATIEVDWLLFLHHHHHHHSCPEEEEEELLKKRCETDFFSSSSFSSLETSDSPTTLPQDRSSSLASRSAVWSSVLLCMAQALHCRLQQRVQEEEVLLWRPPSDPRIPPERRARSSKMERRRRKEAEKDLRLSPSLSLPQWKRGWSPFHLYTSLVSYYHQEQASAGMPLGAFLNLLHAILATAAHLSWMDLLHYHTLSTLSQEQGREEKGEEILQEASRDGEVRWKDSFRSPLDPSCGSLASTAPGVTRRNKEDKGRGGVDRTFLTVALACGTQSGKGSNGTARRPPPPPSFSWSPCSVFSNPNQSIHQNREDVFLSFSLVSESARDKSEHQVSSNSSEDGEYGEEKEVRMKMRTWWRNGKEGVVAHESGEEGDPLPILLRQILISFVEHLSDYAGGNPSFLAQEKEGEKNDSFVQGLPELYPILYDIGIVLSCRVQKWRWFIDNNHRATSLPPRLPISSSFSSFCGGDGSGEREKKEVYAVLCAHFSTSTFFLPLFTAIQRVVQAVASPHAISLRFVWEPVMEELLRGHEEFQVASHHHRKQQWESDVTVVVDGKKKTFPSHRFLLPSRLLVLLRALLL